MIVAGRSKLLTCTLHDRTTGAPFAAGTVWGLVILDRQDGSPPLIWDGAAWTETPASFPEAIYYLAGVWGIVLSPVATAGEEGGTLSWILAEASWFNFFAPSGTSQSFMQSDDLVAAAPATLAEVNAALAGALSNLDVAVSTRASPADVPSVGDTAAAVRSELATELACVDVAVSTRAAQGVGLRAVTVRLEDDQVPAGRVGNAVVQVWDAGNATFLHEHVTGASTGECALSLGDGTYQLRIAPPPGYSVATPVELVVAGAGVYPVEVTRHTAPVASDPALCRVSGRLLDAAGIPLAGATLRCVAVTPQALGDTLVSTVVVATTAADGTFAVDLMRGAQVAFWCPEGGIKKVTRTVPDAASQDFEAWV